ncbi:restriction endonuclease subunit S, partial [bacterium]|nr:restriction endonuclease subunit S [bacterium]
MSSALLPEGWEIATLGDLAAWGSGGTPSRSEPTFFNGKIPWVTISDLNDSVVTKTAANISQMGLENSSAKLVSKGAVMVALYGSIGKLGVAGCELTTNQAIAYAIPDDAAFNGSYLFHLLRSQRDQLAAVGSGVTQKNIYLGDLKVFKFWLAPRAEQTRIVTKVEELLSDLDAGVAELKAAQKKLGQYRQSLLKAAVEGALTAEWRAAQHAGHSGKTDKTAPVETGAALLARILTERRSRWETRQLAKFQAQGKPPPKDWQSKYPAPVAPETTGLPALPVGWVWASAEQLCDFITKGTTPSKGLDGSGAKVIPFLRVTNLTDQGSLDMADKVFVSEQTHRSFLARSVVYPGDVLMNIVGPPLGQVSVVPDTFPEWNINQAIAIFRAVDGVVSGFLALTLLAPPAQRWLKARSKTTAGQTNLTLEVCRSLPIPLPPEAEQVALIAVADDAINRVAEQAKAIQISLKQSAAQRKNILQAAFS